MLKYFTVLGCGHEVAQFKKTFNMYSDQSSFLIRVAENK